MFEPKTFAEALRDGTISMPPRAMIGQVLEWLDVATPGDVAALRATSEVAMREGGAAAAWVCEPLACLAERAIAFMAG